MCWPPCRRRLACTCGAARSLARDHALCPPLLGLEKPPQGTRCFDFQLKRCRGACHGGESPQAHALRLIEGVFATHLATATPGLWVDSYEADGTSSDKAAPVYVPRLMEVAPGHLVSEFDPI